MIEVSCSRVIVKDEYGNVIIDWTASLFTEIILKTGASKTLIEKRGVFGQQTYIPAMNESIETKNYWWAI